MIKRTNLALGFGVALYFLPHVSNKFAFFPAVIISSLIPDIASFAGKKGVIVSQKKINFLTGFFSSILTCATLSIFLAFVYPTFALPVFLGYSFILTLNSFSKDGIQPFWPFSRKVSNGPIVSGGKIDRTLFYVFLFFDFALLVKIFI